MRSGYLALARLGHADDMSWGFGVDIAFDAPAQLAPGDTGLVRMIAWFDLPPATPGTAIRLYDRGRLIGTGTVVSP
jgi:hypothetical protein